ncbi:MAG: hypothetical protein HQL73_11965 [Magnetococcales bacterium]|nr:hypothetical protein [Magnetococcales bacterium]
MNGPATLNKNSASASEGAKKGGSGKAGLVELTFEQMRQLEEIRHKEEQARIQAEVDKVRQVREHEAASGKSKKPVEKIPLGEAPVVVEERKPGLPERIMKLPKDHPERILFEKGYKEREHKDWRKPSHRRRRSNQQLSRFLFGEILVFVTAVGTLYYGIFEYVGKLEETRSTIVQTLKQKHYVLSDPKIAEDFANLQGISWLPELRRLSDIARSLPFNYETLDENPEEGTYLDYIRRHNKPFDENEAMAWRVREVRHPKKAKGQDK